MKPGFLALKGREEFFPPTFIVSGLAQLAHFVSNSGVGSVLPLLGSQYGSKCFECQRLYNKLRDIWPGLAFAWTVKGQSKLAQGVASICMPLKIRSASSELHQKVVCFSKYEHV